MLIKEYRIPLPLSVEEYRIAQLYMIQKKSRLDSTGEGSGVEIIKNHPYQNGPGGSGQYTKKIYHIGNHIPGWLKSIVPKSALQVIEEAWNAYPYTKMRTTCPFVEKFFVDVETKYLPDDGSTENVFNLSLTELQSQTTDLIDPVKDPIPGSLYSKEEDPLLYVSKKTGRGPLTADWLQKPQESIMCAYKRISVEFRYWGMQGKIEQFIHDGLRKPMLMGHRQAWVWQDEWHGLTIENIRELERETQSMLATKMGNVSDLGLSCKVSNGYDDNDEKSENSQLRPLSNIKKNASAIELLSQESMDRDEMTRRNPVIAAVPAYRWRMGSISKSDSEEEFFDANDEFDSDLSDDDDQEKFLNVTKERFERNSHSGESADSLDSLGTENDDEAPPKKPVAKTTSSCSTGSTVNQLRVLVLVVHGGNPLDLSQGDLQSKENDCERLVREFQNVMQNHYKDGLGRVVFRLVECPQVFKDALSALRDITPEMTDECCKENAGPSLQSFNFPLSSLPILAACSNNFREMVDRAVTKANEVYREFLTSDTGAGFNGEVCIVGDCIGALLAYDAMCRTLRQNSFETDISSCSVPASPMTKHDKFGTTQSGGNFNSSQSSGSISGGRTGDSHIRGLSTSRSVGAGLGAGLGGGLTTGDGMAGGPVSRGGQSGSNRARCFSGSSSCSPGVTASNVDIANYQAFFDASFEKLDETKKAFSDDFQKGRTSLFEGLDQGSLRDSDPSFFESSQRFEFEISKFFAFGSPIGLVLLYKNFSQLGQALPVKPACGQFYNLFHPFDPLSARIEPLLLPEFAQIPPMDVPRYQKFPLGDGLCTDVMSWVNKPRSSTKVKKPVERQASDMSTSSLASWDTFSTAITEDVRRGVQNWWGNERLDYALYNPKNLHQLPLSVLCPLFHISYWESKDVVAFMLRQILDLSASDMIDAPANYRRERRQSSFHIPNPREKWRKKRTPYKIRNLAPNHRANDAIALEGSSQIITARFAYGPLDVATLTGEKIDIYVMNYPPAGEWNILDSCITGSGGRMSYTITGDKKLDVGIYPVKMIVRGDHTTVDTTLAVLPPKTEAVVFSIDGSFSASVSLRGRHPKVQPGAVDVVRHWQEKGYVIIYVTSRPDFQKHQVMLWMAEHNFPFGLVSFCGSLSTVDIHRHKSEYLRNLTSNDDSVIEFKHCISSHGYKMKVVIRAAYGSSKDVPVYSGVGVGPGAIFVIGKHSKKCEKQATYLRDGYSSHLSSLAKDPIARPPAGNSRLSFRRGCFGIPKKERPFTKRH